MFCKWCGSPLKPTDAKCPGCKREQPPLSQCGGFYDLAPEARARLAGGGGVPEAREQPPRQAPQPAARRKRTPVTAIALAVMAVLLCVCVVMLVNRGDTISRLERENASLAAELEETEPVQEDTEPVQEDTEPVQENNGNTAYATVETMPEETTPEETTPEETTPEETTAEETTPGEQELLSLSQEALQMEMTISEGTPACEAPGRTDFTCAGSTAEEGWCGVFTYQPNGNTVTLTVQELGSGKVGIEYKLNPSPGLFGTRVADKTEVTWEYKSGLTWTPLPEAACGEEGDWDAVADLSGLEALEIADSTVYLRCTIVRHSEAGGQITFVVDEIPVILNTRM